MGVWSVRMSHGEVAGPVELVVPAALDTSYALQWGAAGHLLALRVEHHRDLMRVHAGTARRLPRTPDARRLTAIDSSGGRLAIQRDADAGVVTLADGSYTKLADADAWIDFLGGHPVRREGDALVDLETGARTPLLAAGSTGPVHCASKAPECFALWRDADRTRVGRVFGDGRAGPFDTTSEPNNAQVPVSFAVSPDGRRVAIAAAHHVDILDTSTGRSSRHEATAPDCTFELYEQVAWDRDGEAVIVADLCGGGSESVLLRIEPEHPATIIFSGSGWISGLVVAPDGDPIVGVRQVNPTPVLIDGL
jgi:hypothetical protein